MPVITILGVPDIGAAILEEYIGQVCEIVTQRQELGLTHDQVSVFIPADRVSKGLGEEIILQVNGLVYKPERSREVRQALASGLANTTTRFFQSLLPQLRLVEVFIQLFDEHDGFASWQFQEPS